MKINVDIDVYTISADVNARVNFNDIEADDLKIIAEAENTDKQQGLISDTDEL